MFLKVQMSWNVIIPADRLDVRGLMLKKAIGIRLLDNFSVKKATKDLGYFVAVTTLDSIGDGTVRQNNGDVLFPVVFSGITFKMYRRDSARGRTRCANAWGVTEVWTGSKRIFILQEDVRLPKCSRESGAFMNDKGSKIEKDVVVRFIVLAVRWMEAESEFEALASLEGDYLGPVS